MKSVIIHYGSHNYGQYIAFACERLEDVGGEFDEFYCISRWTQEVLGIPGVFKWMFYEYDYDPVTKKMKEDIKVSRIE